jgi:hypothetical protein
MGQPTSREEYEERFHANQKITGFGLDTTMHMPCPFCAAPDFMVYRVIDTETAPDFMVYRVIDTETALVEGAVCSECKRGAAIEFSVNTPSNKQFEMVQTSGEPAPDWLPPMRHRGS